ncbi:MAG TPA: serine hydrolase, partial [Gemmatimonadales bacterium]|nr:serine hydrolase [Gemmatimonadales bacterium]
PDLDDGWATAAPRDVGMDTDALARMTASIAAGDYGNVHAVLIERGEQLVYEAYFPGPDERRGVAVGQVEFDANQLHDLRSVSKSITSALIGLAISRGDVASVDAPIGELLPEYDRLLTGEKRSITLYHLLTMSSGLEWDESRPYWDSQNDERRMDDSADPIGFVLERGLLNEPGVIWNYSGGSTQVLAEVLEHATKQPLAEFAAEVLFEPLGIVQFEWLGDLAGTPSAASGLRLRPRDLAKFGSVYLHGGRWNGVQVISPTWVAASLTSQIENPDPSSPPFVTFEGYGYQWWVNTFQTAGGPLDLATAVGNGGQRIIIVPGRQLAVTILSGFYNDPGNFWTPERLLLERILPAVDSL